MSTMLTMLTEPLALHELAPEAPLVYPSSIDHFTHFTLAAVGQLKKPRYLRPEIIRVAGRDWRPQSQ